MRARFRQHVDALFPGLLDQVSSFAGAHVHDIEPSAGHPCPLDGPLDGLGLDEVGPRQRVQVCAVPLHLGLVVVPLGEQV